jgi:hypothetical protein
MTRVKERLGMKKVKERFGMARGEGTARRQEVKEQFGMTRGDEPDWVARGG